MIRAILIPSIAALLLCGPAFAQSAAPPQGQMPAQGANTPTSSAGAVTGNARSTEKPEQGEMPAQGAETPSSKTGATTGAMGNISKPPQTRMPGQGAATPRSKSGQLDHGDAR